MGISIAQAESFLRESARRPFGGKVLTLGRQDIYFSHQSLEELATHLNQKLADPGPAIAPLKSEFAAKGYMSDENLFKSLGFDELKTIDASGFESAHHLFDLNSRELPEFLQGAFDVIFDGGTIEHVFNVPNALENIFRMLRPKGRIVHTSPSSNHIDHGFYMLSPTLFLDFYTANRFEINTLQVLRYSFNHETQTSSPWEVSNYTPGCLDSVSFGGLDDAMYTIICIATKMEGSTGNVAPQQGSYRRHWGVASENDEVPEIVSDPFVPEVGGSLPHSASQSVGQLANRAPIAEAPTQMLRRLGDLFRRTVSRGKGKQKCSEKGLGLPVVARYGDLDCLAKSKRER